MRCKRLLPAGAIRIQWPADVEFDEEEGFVWSILKPCSFNRDVHQGGAMLAASFSESQLKINLQIDSSGRKALKKS